MSCVTCFLFVLVFDKVVKIIGEGSVIIGAYPVFFLNLNDDIYKQSSEFNLNIHLVTLVDIEQSAFLRYKYWHVLL